VKTVKEQGRNELKSTILNLRISDYKREENEEQAKLELGI
jgi:hypothetical protein